MNFIELKLKTLSQNCSVYEELSKEENSHELGRSDHSQELGRSDHSKEPEYDPQEPDDSSFLSPHELGRSDHSHELGRSDHSQELGRSDHSQEPEIEDSREDPSDLNAEMQKYRISILHRKSIRYPDLTSPLGLAIDIVIMDTTLSDER